VTKAKTTKPQKSVVKVEQKQRTKAIDRHGPVVQIQAQAAEAELRRHAAEWVSAIRNRVAALAQEVSAVASAAKPGTVLARVLDEDDLKELHTELHSADLTALQLTVIGTDLPIPDLLAMQRHICGAMFPLAAGDVDE